MRSLALAAFLFTSAAQAQFILQDSHTTASFRGIHALGNAVAWASGTEGTVLRTTDGGATWQRCATPPDAEKLDFRGIQAFDLNTAIVMSSGKGDLSRLYKTTDACKTWKLVFTNPDKEGFFDTIHLTNKKTLYVFGDPVDYKFALFVSDDGGANWYPSPAQGLDSPSGSSAFAASNSAFTSVGSILFFGTSVGVLDPTQPPGAYVYRFQFRCAPRPQAHMTCKLGWVPSRTGFLTQEQNSGVFSVAGRIAKHTNGVPTLHIVAVGGTYDKPDEMTNTASSSVDDGLNWQPSINPPHGYRSSVVYDAKNKAWITVGTNGTDISRDDGKHWTASKPTAQDAPDADKNWNALSLPFVVGPKGRIGKLRPEALKP